MQESRQVDYDAMTGEEFEQHVSAVMHDMGWDCEVTPASGDFGADLICQMEEEKLVIQCKCYSKNNRIGVSAVQEVFGAKAHYQGGDAIVVFTGLVSSSARRLAKSTGVGLFHIDQLMPGCRYDRTAKGKVIREARERKELSDEEKRKQAAAARFRERKQERRDRERAARARRKEQRERELALYQQRLERYPDDLAAWQASSDRHDTLVLLYIIGGTLALPFVLAANMGFPFLLGMLPLGYYAFRGSRPGPKPKEPSTPRKR